MVISRFPLFFSLVSDVVAALVFVVCLLAVWAPIVGRKAHVLGGGCLIERSGLILSSFPYGGSVVGGSGVVPLSHSCSTTGIFVLAVWV